MTAKRLEIGHYLGICTLLFGGSSAKSRIRELHCVSDHLIFLQESVPPKLSEPVNLQGEVSEAPVC